MTQEVHYIPGGEVLQIPDRCTDCVWVKPTKAAIRIWERGENGNAIRSVAVGEPVCALIDQRLQTHGQIRIYLNSGQICLCMKDGSKPPKPKPPAEPRESRKDKKEREEREAAGNPPVDPPVDTPVDPPVA